MVRILKSIPIVVMNEGVQASSQNLSNRHDLPTPESPMSRSCWRGGEREGMNSGWTVDACLDEKVVMWGGHRESSRKILEGGGRGNGGKTRGGRARIRVGGRVS